jgi:predicted transcriptional regulator
LLQSIVIFVKFGKAKSMTKEKAIETIQTLPQLFELDELIQRLIFIDKVEKGLEQSSKGILIPHEEVKLRLRRK